MTSLCLETRSPFLILFPPYLPPLPRAQVQQLQERVAELEGQLFWASHEIRTHQQQAKQFQALASITLVPGAAAPSSIGPSLSRGVSPALSPQGGNASSNASPHSAPMPRRSSSSPR